MDDKELIGYAALHCRTDRALFSIDHLIRLHELAGVDLPQSVRHRSFCSVYRDYMDPLLEKARKNLKKLELISEVIES